MQQYLGIEIHINQKKNTKQTYKEIDLTRKKIKNYKNSYEIPEINYLQRILRIEKSLGSSYKRKVMMKALRFVLEFELLMFNYHALSHNN